MKTIVAKLNKLKYPLIILLFGIMLMLFPSASKAAPAAGRPELGELLSLAQGVGDARVLISDEGVIVVCDGADNAEVRWKVMEAVRSYTGLSSDKICILKSK